MALRYNKSAAVKFILFILVVLNSERGDLLIPTPRQTIGQSEDDDGPHRQDDPQTRWPNVQSYVNFDGSYEDNPQGHLSIGQSFSNDPPVEKSTTDDKLHIVQPYVIKNPNEDENPQGHRPDGQSFINDQLTEESPAINESSGVKSYVIDNPNEEDIPQVHIQMRQSLENDPPSEESPTIDISSGVKSYIIDIPNEVDNPQGHIPLGQSYFYDPPDRGLNLPHLLSTERSKVNDKPIDQALQEAQQLILGSDLGDEQPIQELFEWPEHSWEIEKSQLLTLKEKLKALFISLPKKQCPALWYKRLKGGLRYAYGRKLRRKNFQSRPLFELIKCSIVRTKEIPSAGEQLFIVKQCCTEIEGITSQSNGAFHISCPDEIPVVWGCLIEQNKIEAAKKKLDRLSSTPPEIISKPFVKRGILKSPKSQAQKSRTEQPKKNVVIVDPKDRMVKAYREQSDHPRPQSQEYDNPVKKGILPQAQLQ